jgi:proteasome lid subunit RPN8/RPN11
VRDLISKLKKTDTKERCGFVLKSGRVVEVKNIAPDPTTGYRVDPRKTIEWISKKRSPAVATWHTHPAGDPNLSHEDYATFLGWPDMTHYIVGRRDGKPHVVAYQVRDGLVVSV